MTLEPRAARPMKVLGLARGMRAWMSHPALFVVLSLVGCGRPLQDRIAGTWAFDYEANAEVILAGVDRRFKDLPEEERKERIREAAESMREHGTVDRIVITFSEDGATMFMKPLRDLYEKHDWITDGRDFSKGCAVEEVEGDRMLLAATDQYGSIKRFGIELKGDRITIESEKSDVVVYCKRVVDQRERAVASSGAGSTPRES